MQYVGLSGPMISLAPQWIRCIFYLILYPSYLVFVSGSHWLKHLLCVPMCVCVCVLSIPVTWICLTKLTSFHGHVKGFVYCSLVEVWKLYRYLLSLHCSWNIRPCLDPKFSPQISLCKKEILHHIKMSANEWSTKYRWN
jgi:hypothetical protein